MLAELLRAHVAERGTHHFLRFEGQIWTWGDADRLSDAVAGELLERGIGAGDRVLAFLPNRPEFLWWWMACWKLGVTLVPLNIGLRGAGLRQVIEHADTSAAIIDPSLEEVLVGSGALLPAVRWRVGPETELALHHAPARDLPAVPAEAVAAIIYTSGTTGTAKGVMLSHEAYRAGGKGVAEIMALADSSTVLHTSLPLFHCAAQELAVACALHAGCTIVLRERFEAEGFWDDLDREGATVFHAIGFMTNELWRQADDPDRHFPPRICIGGGPRLKYREFEERFNARFAETFGMTETCGGCLFGGPGQSAPGTSGWESENATVRVVDGELRLKARRPHVFMEGYFRRPDLSIAAFDEEGWYRTGDAGQIEADGSVRWLGRLGDIIRRKGENMSAVEIEGVLIGHPAIGDAGVVPLIVEGDEEVAAHVVLAPGATLTEGEVLDWCRGRMAHFMIPRFVRFTDELPKTVTGRIQKFRLKEVPVEKYWDRREAGYRLRPTTS